MPKHLDLQTLTQLYEILKEYKLSFTDEMVNEFRRLASVSDVRFVGLSDLKQFSFVQKQFFNELESRSQLYYLNNRYALMDQSLISDDLLRSISEINKLGFEYLFNASVNNGITLVSSFLHLNESIVNKNLFSRSKQDAYVSEWDKFEYVADWAKNSAKSFKGFVDVKNILSEPFYESVYAYKELYYFVQRNDEFSKDIKANVAFDWFTYLSSDKVKSMRLANNPQKTGFIDVDLAIALSKLVAHYDRKDLLPEAFRQLKVIEEYKQVNPDKYQRIADRIYTS